MRSVGYNNVVDRPTDGENLAAVRPDVEQLPVLQSCGHSASAREFRDRVLQTPAGQHPSCTTCHVPIIPWAPRNLVFWPDEQALPARYADVSGGIPKSVLFAHMNLHGVPPDGQGDPVRNAQLDYDYQTVRLVEARTKIPASRALLTRSKASMELADWRAARCDLEAARHLDRSLQDQVTEQLAALPPPVPTVVLDQVEARIHLPWEPFKPLCPILCTLPYDAVSLDCGHSFERTALLRVGASKSGAARYRAAYGCLSCFEPRFPWHFNNYALQHAADELAATHEDGQYKAVDHTYGGYRIQAALPLDSFDVERLRQSLLRRLGPLAEHFATSVSTISPASRQAASAPWLTELTEMLHLYPQLSEARLLRCRVHAWSGALPEAAEDYADYALAHPSDDEALGAYLVALRAGAGLQCCLEILNTLRPKPSTGALEQLRREAYLSLLDVSQNDAPIEMFAAGLDYSHSTAVAGSPCAEEISALCMRWVARHPERLPELLGNSFSRRLRLMEFNAENGEYEATVLAATWGDINGTAGQRQRYHRAQLVVWVSYLDQNWDDLLPLRRCELLQDTCCIEQQVRNCARLAPPTSPERFLSMQALLQRRLDQELASQTEQQHWKQVADLLEAAPGATRQRPGLPSIVCILAEAELRLSSLPGAADIELDGLDSWKLKSILKKVLLLLQRHSVEKDRSTVTLLSRWMRDKIVAPTPKLTTLEIAMLERVGPRAERLLKKKVTAAIPSWHRALSSRAFEVRRQRLAATGSPSYRLHIQEGSLYGAQLGAQAMVWARMLLGEGVAPHMVAVGNQGESWRGLLTTGAQVVAALLHFGCATMGWLLGAGWDLLASTWRSSQTELPASAPGFASAGSRLADPLLNGLVTGVAQLGGLCSLPPQAIGCGLGGLLGAAYGTFSAEVFAPGPFVPKRVV